jgi:hypothetical protein
MSERFRNKRAGFRGEAELVKNLKTSSTNIVKNKGHTHFGWQSGYGAFSVSQLGKESVISYIANQESHHRKMTFQEEFRSLFKNMVLPSMSDMFGTDPSESYALSGRVAYWKASPRG